MHAQDQHQEPEKSNADQETPGSELQSPETPQKPPSTLYDHLSFAGESITGAGISVRDGFLEGVKKVGSLGTAVQSVYTSLGNQISNTIRGARNFAAEVTSVGGNIVGLGGGIAGEISLVSAGGIPFLVFGGLPLELGVEFGKLCDSLSQGVRGSSPQFIGVRKVEAGFFKSEDVNAILYMPSAHDADSKGFITRTEKQLAHMIVDLQSREGTKEQSAVSMAAIAAIQEYKATFGMSLDTPRISAQA